MGQAQPSRTPPTLPPLDLWQQAVDDYQSGHVLPRSFQTSTGRVSIAMTLTFMKAWRSAPLAQMERVGVQSVCVMLARGISHPMLSATRMPIEPIGAQMASPSPGITVTWMPHWSRDEPVLMTITVER